MSCEAAETPSLLITTINRTLKIPNSGFDPLQELLNYLQQCDQRTFVILDNFETPWLSANQESIRQILSQLDSAQSLTILITSRVTVLPQGINWTKPIPPILAPFSLEAAKITFYEIVGQEEIHLNPESTELEELLQLVDMVPLAVTLLASVAQTGESISNLRRAWEKERTAIISDGSSNKNTNIEVSIKLSLNSSVVRSNPRASRLLTLLCLFPDGTDRSGLEQMTSIKNTDSTIRALKLISLIYEEHSRLKVLSPIRGFILSGDRSTLHDEDKDLAIKSYIKLTLKGDCWPGDDKFLKAAKLLQPESGNIHSILSIAISQGPPSAELALALLTYTGFLTLTNPNAELLGLMVSNENWEKDLDPELRARILHALGIAYTRLDLFERGLAQCKKARSFALKEKLPFIAAKSLGGIGDTYRRQGNFKKALESLQQAQEEFQLLECEDERRSRLPCCLAIGTCLLGLYRNDEGIEYLECLLKCVKEESPDDKFLVAEILERLADAYEKAGNIERTTELVEESYPLFKEIGDKRGECAILKVAGMLMYRTKDYGGGVKVLQEAAQLVPDSATRALIHGLLGMGYRGLGRLNLAGDSYKHAIQIYKSLGRISDEADWLLSFGQILSLLGDPECIGVFQRSRVMFASLGMKGSEAESLYNEVTSKQKFNQPVDSFSQAELFQMYEQAREDFFDKGNLVGASRTCLQQGVAYRKFGNIPAAIEAYEAALEGYRKAGSVWMIPHLQKALLDLRVSDTVLSEKCNLGNSESAV